MVMKKPFINQHSAGIRQTRVPESGKQECRKAASKSAGKRQAISENTTETTSEKKVPTELVLTSQGKGRGKKDIGGSRRKRKSANPSVKRLVEWYYEEWSGSPPEILNGNGAGRIAKIFSDLLSSLNGREGVLFPEDHVKKLYGFYRTSKPSGKKEEWLFGDEVKSLVRFRSKYADIEECWNKKGEGAHSTDNYH